MPKKKDEIKKFAVTLFLVVSFVAGGSPSAIATEFSGIGSEVVQDESIENMQKLQEAPPPAYEPKDAEEQAKNYLANKGFGEGMNSDKGNIFVQIGIAFFDSEAPFYDDTFITKRSLKTMEASLEAKSKIIEFIRTEMSAVDQAITPGTDLNAEFKDQIDKAERKMDVQRKRVAKLFETVDQAEAENLNGVTFGDRLNVAMDAAIAKLDEEYSKENIQEEKRQKYEKAKVGYQDALKTYEELEKKLEAQKGAVKETLSSEIETLSQMPLFGAVTLAQFESWDESEGRYRVALIVAWSPKMERLARAFISGEDFKVPPGKTALRDWIREQDWSTATGGRRFRDSSGTPYFLGVAASPIGKSASSEKKARGVSEGMAKKEVAMTIFSDVESYKYAGQMMETRNGGAGKDTSVAAETFANNLKQKIEKRTIHGFQKLYGAKLLHPISQQKIYVTIYGVSGESAKQALMMQERNYLTQILDVKQQQVLKGKTDAFKEKVKQAGEDKSEYQKSKAATTSKVDQKASQEYNRSAEIQAPATGSSASTQGQSGGGRARSGTYKGAGSDDPSW